MKKSAVLIEKEAIIKAISSKDYEENILGDMDALENLFLVALNERKKELDSIVVKQLKQYIKEVDNTKISEATHLYEIKDMTYNIKPEEEKVKLTCNYNIEFRTEWDEKQEITPV